MAPVSGTSCKISISLVEDCHLKSLSENEGFYLTTSFSEADKALLELRCGIQFTEDDVCYHHEKTYLSSYQWLQKKCADPYKQNKRQVTSTFWEKLKIFLSVSLCVLASYWFQRLSQIFQVKNLTPCTLSFWLINAKLQF